VARKPTLLVDIRNRHWADDFYSKGSGRKAEVGIFGLQRADI
jgi:hypothetical protein